MVLHDGIARVGKRQSGKIEREKMTLEQWVPVTTTMIRLVRFTGFLCERAIESNRIERFDGTYADEQPHERQSSLSRVLALFVGLVTVPFVRYRLDALTIPVGTKEFLRGNTRRG